MVDLKRYCTALLRYRRSKGYGIHSPFAFNFVCNVLRERLPYYVYSEIQELRARTMELIESYGPHPRVISFKNAKLLFRVTNYFNPTNILQIGTSYGVSTLCMLKVSSKSNLILSEPNIDEYEVTREIIEPYRNRIITLNSISEGITEYATTLENDEKPFILVNSVPLNDYDMVFSYIKGICENEGVVIMRNIGSDKEMHRLWHECRDISATGQSFSNGRIAVIVATEKLQHERFSLWF